MKKIDLIYAVLIFFLLIHFKFFENVYLVLKYNLQERLISNYGYCGGTSYGFLKYINSKYKHEKNLNIYNDDKSFPHSEAFVFKPKREYEKDYMIILNYNEHDSYIDMKDYLIVEKFKNCFYLKKR